MEKRKLLLVDDESSIRLTLGTILQLRGYDVTAVGSVSEALASMQQLPFEVLVSDLNIGAPYDGFTISSAMRRIHPRAAIVMITGYPAFDDALESIRQQVDEYLIKPTDVDELVNQIETKLEKRKHYRPGQQKRAIPVVHENCEHIVKRWMTAVENDTDLSALPVSATSRKGHLSQFIDALTAQVEAHEPQVSKATMDAAALYGKHRFGLGYSIPLVMRETRILTSVIFDVLQEFLLEIKISRLISDVAELGLSIQKQLEQSVRAFIEMDLAARPA
jgi:ActR/RegA family two-component response regulator